MVNKTIAIMLVVFTSETISSRENTSVDPTSFRFSDREATELQECIG